MADTFTFTLDEETEKRLFELLTEVDVSKTPAFTIKDKHGNEAEYVKVVRCKDCKRFYANDGTASQCRYSGNKEGYCFMAERKETT